MSCKLCVALDVASVAEARALVERIDDPRIVYKIGYHLLFQGGMVLADELAAKGVQIFVDLKLHDIGNTIEKGVASLSRRGFAYLTVHAYPQTLRAAVQGRADAALKLLGVSVLTSYDDADMLEAGYGHSVADVVQTRLEAALSAGVDGLVCSPKDLSLLREKAQDKLELVTPGIRPAGSAQDDQKRAMTPVEAIQAGASMLVVGRPIVMAKDPQAAAHALLEEISHA